MNANKAVSTETDALLPSSTDDLSAELVSQVLSTSSPGIRVSDAVVSSMTHGTSTRIYLEVNYEGQPVTLDGRALPRQLFLKTSLRVSHAGYDLGRMGLFGSEVNFYRELRPLLPVPTPSVFASVLAEDGRFLLVMEDLIARGHQWPVTGGCLDPEAAGRVIDRLAVLHASTWRNSRFLDRAWLQSSLTGGLADLYRATLTVDKTAEKLQQPRAELLAPQLRDPELLTSAFWALRERTDRGPQCLVHGDPHMGNMAFARSGAPVLTDWQVVRRSSAGYDLAFFLGSSLAVDDRRRHEDEIIARYVAGLAARGVAAEDLTGVFEDYQVSLVHGLLTWLRNADSMQPPEVNNANLERFATAVADHDSTGRLLAHATD